MNRRSPNHRRRAAALTCAAAISTLALGACIGGSAGSSAGLGPAPAGTTSTAPAPTIPSGPPPTNPGPDSPLQRVVPEPAEIVADNGTFTLDATTTIGADAGSQDVANDLAAAVKQQLGLAPAVGAAGTIQLTLRPAGADPKIGTEGYQLDIDPKSVHVTADSAAGLFHGVQTIRQLLGTQPALPDGHITDYPRFAYRGAMLDVARHFFSVQDVEKYIDDVALYKVDELHLHMTDDQGWRFDVPQWPKLASYGGQTQVGGGAGGFYTPQDYQTIVAYAAARFVNVVPEIDMPGHVGAAVASYPQLACDGRSHKLVTSVSPSFDSLCTSKSSTYTFVDNAVSTLAAATPGPYLHVGGDEASALTQVQYNTFVAKAQTSVTAQNKTPIAWAELASGPIAPGTVAEFWNTGGKEPYIATAAAHGTKFILAPGTHAYMDQQPVPAFPLGLHWAGYTTVSKSYNWDPATLLYGVPEASVLGVEATLFTETVHSIGDAETLAFPRLPAVAEIGWSPVRTHDWTGFATRLAHQGSLWDKLGITYYKSPEISWQ